MEKMSSPSQVMMVHTSDFIKKITNDKMYFNFRFNIDEVMIGFRGTFLLYKYVKNYS